MRADDAAVLMILYLSCWFYILRLGLWTFESVYRIHMLCTHTHTHPEREAHTQMETYAYDMQTKESSQNGNGNEIDERAQVAREEGR